MTENENDHQNENTDDHHEERPRYDDVNIPVVVMTGFITVVLTILTIAFVHGVYNHWKSSLVDELQYSAVDTRRQAIIDGQNEKLAGVDGKPSFEKAMEMVINKESSK